MASCLAGAHRRTRQRALGVDNLHPGPGRRHPAPLPVAVAIGCGADVLEAHRSAAGRRDMGGTCGTKAEVIDGSGQRCCEIVRRRLPLDGLVDFHALAENVRRGGD